MRILNFELSFRSIWVNRQILVGLVCSIFGFLYTNKCICFVDRCLPFLFFFFSLLDNLSSSFYNFLLPLWYLQAFRRKEEYMPIIVLNRDSISKLKYTRFNVSLTYRKKAILLISKTRNYNLRQVTEML